MYGFIAEEVAEVDPKLCFYTQDAEGATIVEGVLYEQLISLLLQEAKQLKAEREQDAARIAQLEAARELDRAEIAALRAQTETLLLVFQQHLEAV